MREEGVASLWIGRAESREALNAALLVQFSPNGDFEGSEFSRAFGIPYYEDGLRELIMTPTTSSLDELLKGVSYEQHMVSRFRELGCVPDADTNCAVLLFNIRYTGTARQWQAGGVRLRFCGTAAYEDEQSDF